MLIPLNWALESLKWQTITAPIEKISYRTATRSVYSGIFLGNLAPARATEFLARIIFFQTSNRPAVTVLHFIGGMFQLCVTIIAGLIAFLQHLPQLQQKNIQMAYLTLTAFIVLLSVLVLVLTKTDWLFSLLPQRFKVENQSGIQYNFTPALVLKLFTLSVLRYLVFYTQFALLIQVFSSTPLTMDICGGIALYFLLTSTIPMFSLFEAFTRAAIAIMVFRSTDLSDSVLALTSVTVWLVNIIIPSIAGYCILLQQNFNFKLFRSRRWSARS